MDDIKIPMLNGNIHEFESDNPNESGTSDNARDKWVSQNRCILRLIMTKPLNLSRIQIDFSSLSRQLKDLRTNDSVKKMHDNLSKELQSKQETLERIQAPNMKVTNNWNHCSQKISLSLSH